MKCTYQTRSSKLAKDLKLEGFDYTLKNKIYEFVYTKDFGKMKDILLYDDEFTSS